MHGFRRDGDDCWRGQLLDHRLAIRQQQLSRSNFRDAELHTVAKASQAISFTAPATRNFGSGPVTLGATASSGAAVSYSSSTTAVCTVSGSTVTLVAAGTCTITAAQGGNSLYLPAASVARSFVINKAGQSISFANLAGRTFGAAPFNLSATSSSGLAVSFSSATTAVCTVSGSRVTIRAAGSCSIRANQAGNGNYCLPPRRSPEASPLPRPTANPRSPPAPSKSRSASR